MGKILQTSSNLLPIVFEEISDDDKAFEHYIKDIILKLLNVEIMTDANDFCRKIFPIGYAQNLAQLKSAF
ncbi:unnamed protein product [Rhizophagus irregularis]|uniref:Uncharacterized protein n=1 Tax=Rhizophagus irregularis TaxID=588596 RepID=A0A916E3U6_9GLOM|nr:unnamed protein product [Rhizophagus irregularis]CAB5357137.1 unnamed protein product [Rhizophagus irregularis]